MIWDTLYTNRDIVELLHLFEPNCGRLPPEEGVLISR